MREGLYAAKNILFGVTGGIAAYQTVDLIGMLRSQLADVRVMMTEAATRFITPLTLQIASGNPVTVHMFDGDFRSGVEHINLARSAHIGIVAPATGNFLGKLANGIADDMLTTTMMAVKAPVLICPAMNENMWLNPIVQENVQKLKRLRYRFVDPEYGEMACGGEGWGRLASLQKIVAATIEIAGEIDGRRPPAAREAP